MPFRRRAKMIDVFEHDDHRFVSENAKEREKNPTADETEKFYV